MPNLFIPKYSTGESNHYYYVASRTSTRVLAYQNIDWSMHDQKGRAVGFSWGICREIVVLEEGEHNDRTTAIYPVGKPLDRFIATGCQTRNGVRFGSGDITIEGTDLETVRFEMLNRIERSRIAAAKKWEQKLAA